jgi:hypothetical protein
MNGAMLYRGVERAVYRLTSLVLVQAIVWLGVGSGILSIETKNELL